MIRLFTLFLALICSSILASEDPPAAYKGRFRPVDVQARLWLYDFYHSEHLKRADEEAFGLNTNTADAFLWSLHFRGHQPFDDAPLFWTNNAELKKLLHLAHATHRYSFNALHDAIYGSSNHDLVNFLITYQFIKQYQDPFNRSKSSKQELKDLSSGLWVALKDNALVFFAPSQFLGNSFTSGQVINPDFRAISVNFVKVHQGLHDEVARLMGLLQKYELQTGTTSLESSYEAELQALQDNRLTSEEIVQALDAQFPLQQRLSKADDALRVLPSKFATGEWLPLKALALNVYDPKSNRLKPISNFTLYPETLFQSLQHTYFQLAKAVANHDATQTAQLIQQLREHLLTGYEPLAGTVYKSANGKKLYYPSLSQLNAENFYYKAPLSLLAIVLYAAAFFLFLWPRKSSAALIFMCAAFLVHTFVLILRCYILQRPPVSNMFETIVYVPWITSIASFVLAVWFRRTLPLIAASLAAVILLTLLEVTGLNNSLENVQAVLDSQYWLIIHVLLVVGSYGAFVLCGILGHFYLINSLRSPSSATNQFIGSLIVRTMYTGLAMLIPGTILGGVWAAESWGRFWDWDPKESWAFISICTYLIWVHAYRFGHIRYFGLAVGSIIGLQVISFTWYGVNYILGTGLHSYGFGSGGEIFYYLFLLAEMLFLATVLCWHKASSIERAE